MFRLACLFLVLLAFVPDADARRRRRDTTQRAELKVDLDIGVATEANSSNFDVQLSSFLNTPFKEGTLVAPQLRRHVLNPNEVYVRVWREGSTIETRTAAYAGGTGNLGPVYARAQIGIEHDDVRYDPMEGSYIAAPMQLELGFRPVEILRIAAYGKLRPVIDSTFGERAGFQSRRDGTEVEAGGLIGFSTPNDVFYVSLMAGVRSAEWTFEGNSQDDDVGGDFSERGVRGTFTASYQAGPTFSWILRATGAREYWDNQRLNQALFFEGETERWVNSLHADLGFVYWHEKRAGFRVSLGGGYDSERPHVNSKERGTIRFGLGVNYRF